MAARVDEGLDLAVTPAPKRRRTAHQASEGTDDFSASLLSHHLEESADGGGLVGSPSSMILLWQVCSYVESTYDVMVCRTG